MTPPRMGIALAALYQTGDDHETAVFVTTPLLKVGVDVPDIGRVVMFLNLSSSLSLMQMTLLCVQ